MKTYEGYSSSPDGWNVSSTLELEDDGRFSYSEGWPGNYINRICKENDALPLDCTEIYLWALLPPERRAGQTDEKAD